VTELYTNITNREIFVGVWMGFNGIPAVVNTYPEMVVLNIIPPQSNKMKVQLSGSRVPLIVLPSSIRTELFHNVAADPNDDHDRDDIVGTPYEIKIILIWTRICAGNTKVPNRPP